MNTMKRLLAGWLMAFATGATAPTLGQDAPIAAAGIEKWLKSYDAALNSKDLDRLASFYDPTVTIFEGGSTNIGWADYRDNHLGPELEEMGALEFSHSNVSARLLGSDGRAAYVTAEYRLKTRMGDRDIDGQGLETLVLIKDDHGAWKIRHSHTSSRRRPQQAAPVSPRP